MTPSARVQAAIEILDSVIAAAREGGAAADTIIARDFKARRYAGSKDRRAIRHLVYAAIRQSGNIPSSGRAAMIALADPALFDGSHYGPAPIEAGERADASAPIPQWLSERLAVPQGAEQAALLERAPLDLRVNTLKAAREMVLAALPGAHATPYARNGVRLMEARSIETHDIWRSGLVEIQDEGSQLIVEACQARAGMTVIDLCAGAGGKTLALAADMGGAGRIIACDTVRQRLDRLGPRAERAGVTNIETRLLDGGREAAALSDLHEAADIVLVDAPCSGSGTWRRNPEARWRLTPERLQRLVELQSHVLDLAVPLVKPGGALIYAVCSLLDDEGADQIAALLSRHSSLTVETALDHVGTGRGGGLLLTPARDRTDGFFVARILKQ